MRGLDQAYAFLTESKLTKLLLTTYFEAVHNHATRLERRSRWMACISIYAAGPTSSKFFDDYLAAARVICREKF